MKKLCTLCAFDVCTCLRLTWDPSGLLLPAGPGVITFITVVVLLAMLMATGKAEGFKSFAKAKADVCLFRYTKTMASDKHRYDEHLQGP